MGKMSVSDLKSKNRNFDNVLDSYLNLVDGGALSGNVTLGDAITDSHTVNGLVAVTGDLSLGDKTQTAGVLTSKLDTGILNAPLVRTTPAPAATQTAGAFTLTAAMFANGFIVGTGNHATSATVTMPAKAVMVTLFGSGAVVGDTFKWHLHNAATTVNHNLVWTAATGHTIVGSAVVGATAADMETATAGGTSTGWFMTRLTNVDGSTITYRLS
tara:strand:- start:43 stop:684 length:642 start_codon:yes stop_codon:yes gene_type:complete